MRTWLFALAWVFVTASPPSEVVVLDGNVDSLVAQFNAQAGRLRFLAILSPT